MEQRVTLDENGRLEVYSDNGVTKQDGTQTSEIKGEYTISDKDVYKLLTVLNNGEGNYSTCSVEYGMCSVSYFFGLTKQNEIFNKINKQLIDAKADIDHKDLESTRLKEANKGLLAELEAQKKQKRFLGIKIK